MARRQIIGAGKGARTCGSYAGLSSSLRVRPRSRQAFYRWYFLRFHSNRGRERQVETRSGAKSGRNGIKSEKLAGISINMRLKTLELNGFKSFSRKTVLEFSHPIVCVVGPNGSGKSNVVEAIRFVLGEQSMKSMRGKLGLDLIFKGSKHLSRNSHAGVSIYLDNSDKIFKLTNDGGENVNLNYDTISIGREVYTDGLNKYILNGSEVRLKDIHNLLASVSIGSSGHHIISQGEADRILNANGRERKEMIEDALGLKIYQYKIKEAG